MSLQTYFTKFHDNIKLTSVTKKELSDKRDILIGILRDSRKLPSFDEFSQGSYGMFLGIKPVDDEEYDIDVGLRFNVSKDDYRPLEIKDTIYEILKGHTEYGAIIRKPCVISSSAAFTFLLGMGYSSAGLFCHNRKCGILSVAAAIAPGKPKRKTPGSGAEPQRYYCCTPQKEKRKPHFLHAPASQTDHERK